MRREILMRNKWLLLLCFLKIATVFSQIEQYPEDPIPIDQEGCSLIVDVNQPIRISSAAQTFTFTYSSYCNHSLSDISVRETSNLCNNNLISSGMFANSPHVSMSINTIKTFERVGHHSYRDYYKTTVRLMFNSNSDGPTKTFIVSVNSNDELKPSRINEEQFTITQAGNSSYRYYYSDVDGDGFADCTEPVISSNVPVADKVTFTQGVDKFDKCPYEFNLLNKCYPSYTSSRNQNYIKITTPLEPTSNSSSLQNNQKIENITYYDGIGRAMQNIAIRQSPNGKDIVTHIEYDAVGRKKKEYLPYNSEESSGTFKTNAVTKTINYYKTNYSLDINSRVPNPFSEKEFDGSPLNRVMKQSAPGEAWKLGSGKEIRFDYQTNTDRDVREYYVTTTVSGKVYIPILKLNTSQTNNDGFYNAGELYKTITKDEHHSGTNKIHTTEEYKNKQGQVVLKRTYITNTESADTYYVYDDFGNLTYVLSPKSKAHAGKPDDIQLSELCYQYKYDYRNRLVEKKIPGKDWEYIVYDKLDRPVLTQDANQRANNQRKWLFTKYDVLGRVVYTGMYTHSSTITQAQMQSYFDSQNQQYQSTASVKMYETKLTSSGIQGSYYSNNNFPKSNIELLTINYYDNYTFNRAGTGTSVNSYGVVSTSRLKGLATGSRVKVLGDSNKWITTVTYYDEKARPIYVYSKNDFLLSTDIVKSKLDFPGKVEETTTIHTKTDDNLPTITTVDKYSYDHVGRVTQHTQTIGGRTEVIAVNEYDNLGQLKKKNVGGIHTRRNRLQNIDYTYNIRGWLERINNTSNLGNDLFAFKINYNKPTHGNTNTGLFNGNISETEWRTKNDNALRWYKYSYDPLNRIKSAVDDINRYSLSSINYDENGNIENLQRRGHIVANPDKNYASHFDLMDNLKYTYANNNKSNRLIKVEELQGGNTTHGFKDGNRSGDDYTYDANGNMVKGENKGITKIIYNHLNLPKSVTLSGGTINYTYDATGVKLRKTVSSTITDYAGNYIYKKEGASRKKLEFFNHPEGYVKNDNGTFNYVYQYKDHLGNVRLSYTDADGNGSIENDEIIEESNYYPFGLEHKGYNNIVNPNGNSTAEKFKFQGQELEEELGKNTYAYQWRDYDPALGRFNKIDRFAEKYQSMTPYHFTANNPIRFVEIAGDSITPVGDIQYSKFNVDRSRGIDGGNKYQLYGFTGTTGGKDVQGFVASYQRKSGYRDDYIVDTESVGEFLETSKTQATIANLKEWAGGSGGSLWSRYKSTWTPMNVMTGLTIGMGSSLALASSRKSVPLYHYTSEAGYNSIMKSRTLNPSIGAKNARFGTGQYFTDIQPGSMTMGQTSYRLYGVPWNRTRLTHYIEIDTRGLNIINNKQFNYLNPSSSPLDLGGRILGGGKTPF